MPDSSTIFGNTKNETVRGLSGADDLNGDYGSGDISMLGQMATQKPADNVGPNVAEAVYGRPTVAATDDNLQGTDGADTLLGDPMTAPEASLTAPLSYWPLTNPADGTAGDAAGVSNARFFVSGNGEASLQRDVPTIAGPDGEPVPMFGIPEDSFAYIANDPSYQVLNATVTAWINPTELDGTILSKDALGQADGGHFHVKVTDGGRLHIRVAEGNANGDGGYNHEWQTKEPLLTAGSWQNIALTFGAAGVSVFIDGEELSDDQFDTVSGDAAPSQFTQGYAIGNDNPLILGANTRRTDDQGTAEDIAANATLHDFFEGGITNVGLWGGATPGGALSPAQIAELVANGPGDLANITVASPPPIPVGDDTISSGNGDDVVDGGAGNDVLDGGAGDDRIIGGSGNDVIDGSAGDDTLDGGHGNDLLSGGDGDDRLESIADGREPVIAQDYGDGDDPNSQIDPAARMLYPSQSDMPADDTLTGGAGADEFYFRTVINAKEEIINKHVNDDRTIDWMGVAGENQNVHDHWVDRLGNDVITDFDREEGDRITIEGHTTEVSDITITDVDGDGDLDTVLQLRSNQGANGGAHNLDLLGTITVLDNELTESDFTVDAGVAYGIVETIDEVAEAVTPLVTANSAPPADPTVSDPGADQPDGDAPLDEAPDGDGPSGEAPVDVPPAGDQPASGPPAPLPSLVQSLLTPDAGNPASETPSITNDLLIGTGAADDMAASWGDDRVAAGLGDDVVRGGHGDDLLAGELGDDLLAGGFGDDILLGGGGQDELIGNRGDDVLAGGASDDMLDGGAGDDVVYGGAGEDRLDGGRGLDIAVLDGVAADYTLAAIDGGIIVTDAMGQSDLLHDIERVHFNSSGETMAIENGAFVSLEEDTDDLGDLLEGELLAEILGMTAPLANPASLAVTPSPLAATAAPAAEMTTSQAMSELAELALVAEPEMDAFGNTPEGRPVTMAGSDLTDAPTAAGMQEGVGDDAFRIA